MDDKILKMKDLRVAGVGTILPKVIGDVLLMSTSEKNDITIRLKTKKAKTIEDKILLSVLDKLN